ncbi:MAG: UDP-N-acetylglucosamine 2-epimerase [Tepidisphaeraceae bacterium]
MERVGELASPESIATRGDAVVLLHPLDADEGVERARAMQVLGAVLRATQGRVFVLDPNNDPGHRGILAAWSEYEGDPRVTRLRSPDRPTFLALLRDAGVFVGNSSAGIIEAPSFGVPVVNVGPRQGGRERARNVVDVDYDDRAIHAAVRESLRAHSGRRRIANPYAKTRTARQIASLLATRTDRARLLPKRIVY